MIKRRTSLQEALEEIETGALSGVTAIVVSSKWWQELSKNTQRDYRHRCRAHAVELRADSRLSRHFVELASDPLEPRLSSERRV